MDNGHAGELGRDDHRTFDVHVGIHETGEDMGKSGKIPSSGERQDLFDATVADPDLGGYGPALPPIGEQTPNDDRS
jgi:hypothetical protein